MGGRGFRLSLDCLLSGPANSFTTAQAGRVLNSPKTFIGRGHLRLRRLFKGTEEGSFISLLQTGLISNHSLGGMNDVTHIRAWVLKSIIACCVIFHRNDMNLGIARQEVITRGCPQVVHT